MRGPGLLNQGFQGRSPVKSSLAPHKHPGLFSTFVSVSDGTHARFTRCRICVLISMRPPRRSDPPWLATPHLLVFSNPKTRADRSCTVREDKGAGGRQKPARTGPLPGAPAKARPLEPTRQLGTEPGPCVPPSCSEGCLLSTWFLWRPGGCFSFSREGESGSFSFQISRSCCHLVKLEEPRLCQQQTRRCKSRASSQAIVATQWT